MAKYLASLNEEGDVKMDEDDDGDDDDDDKSHGKGNDGSAVSILLLEQLMSFVPETLNPANNGMAFADILAILCNLALGADFGHFYVSHPAQIVLHSLIVLSMSRVPCVAVQEVPDLAADLQELSGPEERHREAGARD